MIRAAKGLGICLLALTATLAGPAAAQLAGPAEIPSYSFRGDQYVDSGGCVFIRTAIDGATRWVPRVDRDRAPVCGARPSAAVPMRVASVGGPIPAAVAPVPRRRVARAAFAPGCGTSAFSVRFLPGCAAAERGQIVATSASTRAAPVAAGERRFAIARPRRADEQVVTRLRPPAGAVRIVSDIPSPNRSIGAAGVAVGAARGCDADCGASGNRIATRVPAAVAARPQVVVVPAARTTFDVSTPPRGYRRVWTDGRLNPHRGPRTLQGDYQSQAIWTKDAPRRLRGVIYSSR